MKLFSRAITKSNNEEIYRSDKDKILVEAREYKKTYYT
jgi:hypothetical protein